MQNANLTWAQDLGADTELLSGDFYVPFGRSTSHQLWSSAMVITPTLRGLFGIDIDAQTKTITVNPHLPASWDQADVTGLPLGSSDGWMHFERVNGVLEVRLTASDDQQWKLRCHLPGAHYGEMKQSDPDRKAKLPLQRGLSIPLPAIEADNSLGLLNPIDVVTAHSPDRPPLPGARTAKFRVIRSEYGDHKLVLEIEGEAGTDGILRIIRNGNFVPKIEGDANTNSLNGSISVRSCDADPLACASYPLTFHLPEGLGWETGTITVRW
jgi:hypothetical protein